MATMRWDDKAVIDYLRRSPLTKEFVRVKEPRGIKAFLRKHFNGTLYRQCFRNSMVAACGSPDKLLYCEGYAGNNRGGWYAHAWVAPFRCKVPDVELGGKINNVVVHLDLEPDQCWCMDFTWPWRHKGKIVEAGYVGICIYAPIARDFMRYMQYMGLVENPSFSILKNLEHFKQFLTGMH